MKTQSIPSISSRLGSLSGAAGLLLAALLAACAAPSGYNVRALAAGDPRDRVEQVMGAPTATHALPGGATRLEYSHAPSGRVTYMVDLGPDGRLVRWEQVLDEVHFQRLHAGMSREQVLAELGSPSERGHYLLPAPAETWTYHFLTRDACEVFQIAFSEASSLTLDHGATEQDPRCGMAAP